MFQIQKVTKQDFHDIIEQMEVFWGTESDELLFLHHVVFLYEFGNTSFVAKDDDDTIVAYVLGCLSQKEPGTAYCHIGAVRPEYRGQGVGAALFNHFVEYVRARGCTRLKTITPPDDVPSIRFLLRMGCVAQGKAEQGQVPTVKNYWALGVDRVVFFKNLARADA